jgi:hypothetical protein
MYAQIVADTSFWLDLLEIDDQLRGAAKRAGCPRCSGPLHVGDYPRQPRGIPETVEQVFSTRLSLCCGHCRKRVTPASVRFLGRKVYAGAILVLAVAKVLICTASARTLQRWQKWWVDELPRTPWWLALQAMLVPAVELGGLPGSLLERFECKSGSQTSDGLTNMLRALSPITTLSCTHFEGAPATDSLTHKMRFDHESSRDLRRQRAPTKTD